MFNTIKVGGNSSSVTFNQPCTGILQRSHPSSIFIRFAVGSNMEKWVFPHNGDKPHMCKTQDGSGVSYKTAKKYEDKGNVIEIVVLQVLLFGDNQYLVEVIEPEFLKEQ